MVFKCFPTTDHCCVFIQDLKFASLLVALLCALRGSSVFTYFISNEYEECPNLNEGEIHLIVLNYLVLISCGYLISASVLIAFYLLIQNTIKAVGLFIGSIIFHVCTVLLYSILASIKLSRSSFFCTNNKDYPIGLTTTSWIMIRMLIGTFIAGIMLSYFAVVVNSYDEQLKELRSIPMEGLGLIKTRQDETRDEKPRPNALIGHNLETSQRL